MTDAELIASWWRRYRQARASMAELTRDELGRLMVKHARRCTHGCSFVEYSPDEADLVVEFTCTIGATVNDELDARVLRAGTGGEP